MLEIGMKDVIKNYGFKNVLDGVSLEIMTGDRVALVGRNGSGKSTILKVIAGEEAIHSGLVTTRRGTKVGYLEQIPRLVDTDTTVRDMLMLPFAEIAAMERRLRQLEARMSAEQDETALADILRQYAFQQSQFETQGGYAVEEKAARIATGFGLMPLLNRSFNVLSGGQKTIVMLACTLLRQPDTLLLDEPTNHLDIRTLEWFEQYLAKYRGTVVLVSHDRYFLDRVASKTILLEDGACRLYHGNYTFSIAERERELLVEFEQYKNQQKKIEAMEAAIRRYRDWADRGNNEDMYKKAIQLERRLEKMDMLSRPSLEKKKVPIQFGGGRAGRDVVRMDKLTMGIGGLTLLRDITLTLQHRERICLMGDNGTGKTTLIRTLLGELPSAPGAVFVAAAAQVGYIPQEIRFAQDTMSVLEAFRAEYPCSEGEARGVLAKYFFIGEHVRKRVSGLSGGEKVLLKLAILMQRRINVLILDEPTNHIDIETRETLEEALLAFAGTILFISHDRYFIQKIATRILEIQNQSIEDYPCDYQMYREWKLLAE